MLDIKQCLHSFLRQREFCPAMWNYTQHSVYMLLTKSVRAELFVFFSKFCLSCWERSRLHDLPYGGFYLFKAIAREEFANTIAPCVACNLRYAQIWYDTQSTGIYKIIQFYHVRCTYRVHVFTLTLIQIANVLTLSTIVLYNVSSSTPRTNWTYDRISFSRFSINLNAIYTGAVI